MAVAASIRSKGSRFTQSHDRLVSLGNNDLFTGQSGVDQFRQIRFCCVNVDLNGMAPT
jgi:hypothetical protein